MSIFDDIIGGIGKALPGAIGGFIGSGFNPLGALAGGAQSFLGGGNGGGGGGNYNPLQQGLSGAGAGIGVAGLSQIPNILNALGINVNDLFNRPSNSPLQLNKYTPEQSALLASTSKSAMSPMQYGGQLSYGTPIQPSGSSGGGNHPFNFSADYGKFASALAPIENQGLEKLSQFGNAGTPQALTTSNDLINKIINSPSAKLTSQDQQAIDMITSAAGNQQSPLLDSAANQIMQLLSPTDVANSPLYKSAVDTAKLNQANSISDIKGEYEKSGLLHSTRALNDVAQQKIRSANDLNTLLANLTQQDISNKISVLPQASSISGQKMNIPFQNAAQLAGAGELQRNVENSSTNQLSQLLPSLLNQANAQVQIPQSILSTLFQYGQLPRTVGQAGLDRQYNDYLNGVQTQTTQSNTSLGANPYQYQSASYGASPAEQIAQLLGGGGGQLISNLAGPVGGGINDLISMLQNVLQGGAGQKPQTPQNYNYPPSNYQLA